MAKMHSRKRGTAKSSPPLNPTKPVWIRYTTAELELLIGKLAKEGNTASKIGLILRDSYGIPSVKLITGKTVQQIMSDKHQTPELPEDLFALIRRAAILSKHLQANKHDMSAKRGFQLTESKIKRLVKYYKTSKKLPVTWKYDLSSIKVFIE